MKIGITQRVEFIEAYGERRDCLDQQWFVFFEQIGLSVIPIPNALQDPIAYCESNNIKGFVFSGGNDISSLPGATNTAPERDRTEKLILNYTASNMLPVLGICRGLQFINLHLNGSLSTAPGHVATNHEVKATEPEGIFKEIAIVNSFHNFVVPKEQLGQDLKAMLCSFDGHVEAMQHISLPWLSIMWHPERNKPFNQTDIRIFKTHFQNFL
jgi:N5-(cytidine 5'-diphosphoramidyl)-L-glutamine hydrolase